MNCAVFEPENVESSKCIKCGHTYRFHRHTNIEYIQVRKRVENASIKGQIESHQQTAEDIQKNLIKAREEEIEVLESSKAKIELYLVKTVCFLAQNSIVPVNDSLILYLDTEIKLRENDPKSAEVLKSLRDWKRSHEVRIANFMAQSKQGAEEKLTIEEIDQHLKEMFQLPEYGANLEETYKTIEKKDSLNYKEVHCASAVRLEDDTSMMNNDTSYGVLYYLESAKKLGYETIQSAIYAKKQIFASVSSWFLWATEKK